ncbi:MAG: tetratricopeptide repeat protein [Rhodothermales bacterium]
MDRLDTLLDYHREDPDDPFVRYAIAQEHLKRGETNEALACFERLADEHPDYVGTYYHLGKLYETLGRPDEAIRTYRTGVDRAGQASDLHARSELQGALLEAQGIGFDDE